MCFPYVGPSVIRRNWSPPAQVFLLYLKYLHFFSHYTVTFTLDNIPFPSLWICCSLSVALWLTCTTWPNGVTTQRQQHYGLPQSKSLDFNECSITCLCFRGRPITLVTYGDHLCLYSHFVPPKPQAAIIRYWLCAIIRPFFGLVVAFGYHMIGFYGIKNTNKKE